MPLPQVRTPEDETLHREMERVSLDWCMIYNPTDEDFVIEWLPWKFIVPNQNKDMGWGLGKREVQRYLARWYCEHMTTQIINKKGETEGRKMLAKRREEGKPDLTAYEEQKAVWEKTPRWNDTKELNSLYPLLFLGVTREFGTDYQPEQQFGPNMETPQESVLKTLQNKKYSPNSVKEAITPKKEEIKEEKIKLPKDTPSVDSLEALMQGDDGGKI